MRGLLQINTVGAAGEDNAHGVEGTDFLNGRGIGLDLAVNILFPNPPGDKLIVLTAEIQHQYLFVHILSPVTG